MGISVSIGILHMTDYPLELQAVTYRHKIQTMKYLTQPCEGTELAALFMVVGNKRIQWNL